MIADFEAALFGNAILSFFDLRVVELFDAPAIDADQMVVVLAVVDFEDGLAGFEKVAFEQAGLLELGQYAIDGGQANVHVFIDQ